MRRSPPAHRSLAFPTYLPGVTLSTLVLDALFPDSCLSCLAPKHPSWRHEVACNECLASVQLPDSLACISCASPSSSPELSCHPESPAVLALSPPQSRTVGNLTSSLKYEGMTRAAPPLGELLAGACAASGVPLHRAIVAGMPETTTETRARGYDATALVATWLSAELRIPYAAHLLSASRAGPATVFGIGTVGDAASANLVLLTSLRPPKPGYASRAQELVQAACPHATLVFVTCTA